MAFELPKLPYGYSDLEPYIDRETMTIHHTKHHQTYVDNLNKTLENYPELKSKSIEEILSNVDNIPSDIKQAVINHGGGHINHSFFWEIMSPKSEEHNGKLLDAINSTFGSVDKFKEEFTNKAMGVFGSGWAFLVMTPNKKLLLKRYSFQNSPVSYGNTPIIGIDLWEHAYYLKYQNRRLDYVNAWWNVVNWQKANQIFSS